MVQSKLEAWAVAGRVSGRRAEKVKANGQIPDVMKVKGRT